MEDKNILAQVSGALVKGGLIGFAIICSSTVLLALLALLVVEWLPGSPEEDPISGVCYILFLHLKLIPDSLASCFGESWPVLKFLQSWWFGIPLAGATNGVIGAVFGATISICIKMNNWKSQQ